MKKLLSFIVALGVVGASIFTPFTNVEAASISKAESLVKIAEQHAGALKWQISYELTKEVKYPDMKVFNLTKDAYFQAKAEISKVSVTEKLRLEKRLEENVGIHYKRAMGYIDAITSGKKIVDKTNQYKLIYSSNPTSDVTEASYHSLSSEIRKQAVLLYRVYGKSTRDAILAQYKTPGETALKSTQNVITAKMHLDSLVKMITEKADQNTVETHVGEFFDLLDLIEDEEIIEVLYEGYDASIRKDSSFLTQEQEIKTFLEKSDEYANAENLESLLSLYSVEFPGYENLKTGIETTFKDFDVKYVTLDVNVRYIVHGTALVTHVQMYTVDGEEELEHISNYILQKDEAGNWKYFDVLGMD